MKNLKRKKGFTIVELVIVIAVIGVLSAILIPTFSGVIAESRAKAKQLDLRHAYDYYAIAAMDEAEEEVNVYLSKDATISASSEVYYLDVANAEWKTATVVATTEDVENGEKVASKFRCVSLEGDPAAPVAYNGYYVFVYEA